MILIVDDISANVIALKKTLELHNLEADTAESGEEALKKILKRNYSLIILDVQMPGMDGFEVAETLAGSSRTKDIPVIFLSAVNKQKRYISKGYDAGGVDYITKPVDPDLLIMKVKTFMKLYEQQKELKDMRDLLSKEIEIRKEAQENLEQKVQERTQELVKKNEEMEFRNHELQQFTWVVSHDLKEPVRKIQMFVKMLIDRYLHNEPAALDYAERSLRSAERMSLLISDLLEYSRLSSGAAFQKTNVNDVINEVIRDFDYIVEDRQAKITVENLPEINCIPSQMRQIFQNLISNSLKFSKEGIPPEIEIRGELVAGKAYNSPQKPDGEYCRITVKDNGIGFDEKYLEKIFIIFQSLNDRNRYEGTGIGLAIAKKIIEKHNGLITAESKLGQGATFILILPVKQHENLLVYES